MLWDIFCRVIDNHGDLGVCWRLSSDLASRGHSIRLWVDDASALAWMAPQAAPTAEGWGRLKLGSGSIEVRPWDASLAHDAAGSEVWIEAFGCELPDHFVNWAAAHELDTPMKSLPVWLNLEYLSAEPYVERCHKLPSPLMSGPFKGRTKWFFYPGFTAKTGGLIREGTISTAPPNANIQQGKPKAGPATSTLFCYEPVALSEALQLKTFGAPGHEWHVAHGRGAKAFDEALTQIPSHMKPNFRKLPPLSQIEFDAQLAQSDWNFVRGEDSLVRALWAGKPFIWHIYPQEDGAHGPKLSAFLDWLQAPESLRIFHLRWNDLAQGPLPEPELLLWQECVQAARTRLMAQMDLVSQLLQFVAEKG